MPVATFGPKEFTVSTQKIYTFDELERQASINTETQEYEGGKASTWVKGQNLDQISFTVVLDAAFVDVEEEIEDWHNILNAAKPYPFTIGQKPLSRNNFLLKEISISEHVIGNAGKMLRAKMSLTLEEYVRAGSKQAEDSIKKQEKAAAKGSSKSNSSQSINISGLVQASDYKRDNPNVSAAVQAGYKNTADMLR